MTIVYFLHRKGHVSIPKALAKRSNIAYQTSEISSHEAMFEGLGTSLHKTLLEKQ